jgi:hypothetical protein
MCFEVKDSLEISLSFISLAIINASFLSFFDGLLPSSSFPKEKHLQE